VAAAALQAGLDETVVVIDSEERAAALPDGATVLLDAAATPGDASALRAALDWCARQGHDAVVLALDEGAPGDPAEDPRSWRALAAAAGGPVVVATRGGRGAPLARLDAEAWPLLPLEGSVAATWRNHPELVSTLALDAALDATGGDAGAPPAAAAAGEAP